MSFLEMMKKRESCRSFDGRPASREDLLKIVEAGRLSPSGCNAQPWKFILVDDEEALNALRDALVLENGATGASWRDQVSSFIVIVEMPAKIVPATREYYGTTQRHAPGDLGMAVMNMCYEAMELGLATCILGLIDQDKIRKGFGIPEERDVPMILAVGYPKDRTVPRKKSRKSAEEVCSINRW